MELPVAARHTQAKSQSTYLKPEPGDAAHVEDLAPQAQRLIAAWQCTQERWDRKAGGATLRSAPCSNHLRVDVTHKHQAPHDAAPRDNSEVT